MTAQLYSSFEPFDAWAFQKPLRAFAKCTLYHTLCTTFCSTLVWHCGCAVPLRGATMYHMCHAPQGKVTDMPLQDVVAYPGKLAYPLTFYGCATALTAYHTLYNIIVPSIS